MEIFKPLMVELEQLDEPLNREEFVDATTRLYEQLNQKDKNLILRFGKERKESDYQLAKCTFKPVTNCQNAARPVRSKSAVQRPASTNQRNRQPSVGKASGAPTTTLDRILRQPVNTNKAPQNDIETSAIITRVLNSGISSGISNFVKNIQLDQKQQKTPIVAAVGVPTFKPERKKIDSNKMSVPSIYQQKKEKIQKEI